MPDPTKIVDALNWLLTTPGMGIETAGLAGLQHVQPAQQEPQAKLESGLAQLAPAAVLSAVPAARGLAPAAARLLRGGAPGIDPSKRQFLKLSGAVTGAAMLKPVAKMSADLAAATKKVAALGIEKLPKGWQFAISDLSDDVTKVKRFELDLLDDVGNPIEGVGTFTDEAAATGLAKELSQLYGTTP